MDVAPFVSINNGVDDIGFQPNRSIVTGVGISRQANPQFSSAIGGDLHVYVFGDRIGEMQVSGLSFLSSCETSENGDNGFSLIQQWYETNKMSAKSEPLRLVIGNVPLRAFVRTFRIGNADPKTAIVQFDIGLSLLPKRIL